MEDLEGVDDEWLSGEFQSVEDFENTLIEMTRQGEELVGDVFQACDQFSRNASAAANPTLGDCRTLNKLVKKI